MKSGASNSDAIPRISAVRTEAGRFIILTVWATTPPPHTGAWFRRPIDAGSARSSVGQGNRVRRVELSNVKRSPPPHRARTLLVSELGLAIPTDLHLRNAPPKHVHQVARLR